MMILRCVFLLCFSILFLSCIAQKNTIFQPLKIGDTVPDYAIRNLFNYSSKSAKLSDFKGKLLLLDFWATWCTWCVAAMPKMEELQAKFDGKLQIILVNHDETEAKGRDFFSKRERIANLKMTLPMIYGDKTLTDTLFKHTGSLPRIFWIDENGIIKHITLASEVNESNIRAILSNQPVKLRAISNDILTESREDIRNFYFSDTSRQSVANIKWRSTLYGELKEFAINSIRVIRRFENGLSFIAVANASIVDLYRFAYGDLHLYSNSNHNYIESIATNRTLLITQDSLDRGMTVNNYNEGFEVFSYQLVAPPHVSEYGLQKTMRIDLKKYFGFDAKKEKVLVKCLVLTASDTTLLEYKAGKYLFKTTATELGINDMTISSFIKNIENIIPYGIHYLPPYPIIDETGFKGKLGQINVETNISDYRALDKALQKYGLHLSLEERQIEMLVIRESRF